MGNKVCPLLFAPGIAHKDMLFCRKEECAWYFQQENSKQSNPGGECSIVTIATSILRSIE
jgi:hypothetical protein